MRCPVCGAEDALSPLGELDPTEGYMRVRFKRPGFLEPRPTFFVRESRVCRSCGAVVPFLGQDQREKLAEEWDTLIPVAPDARPGTPPSPESPS
ncbi:hypothetical protein GCM10027258_00670 [Amycolatopsis stemonae]